MAKSFNRDKRKYKTEPSVLVICEDKKSGKIYLEDASFHFRANVHIEFNHCGNTDPLGIVNEAIRRKSKFEYVFCVIDRDSHANFNQALTLANTNGIKIIASYPCFEFWLLLHFNYSRKPYNKTGTHSAADVLIADLKKCKSMENYDKGESKNLFRNLLDKFPQARKFSSKAYAEAIDLNNLNPSTTLHEIMDFFETLDSPQSVD